LIMYAAVISGYPDYIVTSEGEIYSRKYKTPRRLKTHINRGGYERVGLCRDGKQKLFLVHDIVAETFIPNPGRKPYVNHKDENKLNNAVDNLEWCTASENNTYGTRLVRIAESKKKKVVQLDFLGNVIQIWESQTDAANALGLNKRNINQCLRGRRKRCGGFGWRYFYNQAGEKAAR
jgi:hypothetical protein